MRFFQFSEAQYINLDTVLSIRWKHNHESNDMVDFFIQFHVGNCTELRAFSLKLKWKDGEATEYINSIFEKLMNFIFQNKKDIVSNEQFLKFVDSII